MIFNILFYILLFLDQKIRECGMRWGTATIKWIKKTKHKDATKEQNMVKIKKVKSPN